MSIEINKANEFNLSDGYVFKDENGNIINATKIVIEKKKKIYPKTYEECCKILDFCGGIFFTIYEDGIHFPEEDNNTYQILKSTSILTKLLICRDAYWKIAGEEMGLEKPWTPDLTTDNEKHSLVNVSNKMIKSFERKVNRILVFPTEEMLDAFYENFKELIESCKELL